MQMDGTRWLFTGDMEKEKETDLLASLIGGTNSNIRAMLANSLLSSSSASSNIDVLKVAHHGSKTSTTQAWLDYWKPKFAVISVGEKNTYGHPSPEVIQRLEQNDAGIFRTDQMGEIQMEVWKGSLFARFKMDNKE
jgi:competence protein ComEC